MLFDKILKEIVPTKSPKSPQTIEIPKPIYPVLFSIEIRPYGPNYNCMRDERKARRPLIAKLKPGEAVTIEKATWQRKPLFLVVNRKGLDVGTLPEPFYAYMTRLVKNLQIEATVVKTDPQLIVKLDVRGEYKKKWKLADPVTGERGKEYTYYVTTEDEYFCIPPVEIPCELVLNEDTYYVKAAGWVIGTINPERTEKLQGMLDKYNCITTVMAVPHCYDASIKMILRF